MDHTLALIMKSQQGDKEARDTVFKENAGLVYSMAKRESGAEVESLHKIIYQGDGNDISLMDRLQEKENGQDAALNRIFLDEILKKLDARERQLIGMRYFKDMTQTEIAAEMGISQVQVSRMEKRILKELKKQV